MHSSAIAGACAGLVSSVVTCPLDVVKTRLQAQEGRRLPTTPPISPAASTPHASIPSPPSSSQQYVGITSTIKKIYETDGVRGFYRGLGPTIFGYLPTWAIYFTVYDNSKQFLSQVVGVAGGTSGEFVNHIVAAMTAGAASTICTSPLWVVKTRFMLQSARDTESVAYRHTGDAFLQIYRAEGLRGFYKGLLPSLFGVSHVAVQFPLYEAFKGWVRDAKQTRTGGAEELVAGEILLCSSAAKMIASVTTYPHEVLRTRLQMQPKGNAAKGRYTGVIQASKTIAAQEGIRGFYKGMTVNLVRTVPSSALTILTYELIMQHLAHRE